MIVSVIQWNKQKKIFTTFAVRVCSLINKHYGMEAYFSIWKIADMFLCYDLANENTGKLGLAWEALPIVMINNGPYLIEYLFLLNLYLVDFFFLF